MVFVNYTYDMVVNAQFHILFSTLFLVLIGAAIKKLPGISCFFFDIYFIRTHTACCKYEAASCLIYLSTSTGVRTGCHYLISLSASVCMRNNRRFY